MCMSRRGDTTYFSPRGKRYKSISEVRNPACSLVSICTLRQLISSRAGALSFPSLTLHKTRTWSIGSRKHSTDTFHAG